jgi:trans-2,3-dihydro-3-hydroxyanthranilate isomerase
MQLTFHTLDVFTDKRFAGNPLAVVHGADELDGARMQTIAREFTLSETVFLLKPTNPTASAKVRIFTPAQELPFAGHPTVGTAVLLAEMRMGSGALVADQDAIVVLEENIGMVRVGVRLRPGQATFAEFDAPKLPEETGAAPDAQRLSAALGLSPSEIGFANHKPTQYTAGVGVTFVPVSSLAAIARANVHPQHWAAATSGPHPSGMFLYCRETRHTGNAFHARFFAPAMGIAEDPATGSAAAAFAGAVHQFDQLPDGHHKRIIEQGFEMGRPSIIALSLDVTRTRLTTVRIGGAAVRVAEGRIDVG